MAEVQTTTDSGEMTQRFIEFVMMQAQNAALFLGQIPNPRGGEPEINLDIAKMFIDQLVMIRSKTKNNLSNDELAVLNNAISNLQMTFFDVSQAQKGKPSGDSLEGARVASASDAEAETAPTEASDAPPADEEAADALSKKKFSKSYGA